MRRRDEVVAALAAARDLPDGDGRTAELAAVVADADALGDVRLGFDARLELIDALGHDVDGWRMLDPFDWCLAAFDRDPAGFDDADAEQLRWYHRLAATRMRDTPRVELARVRAALDDLDRRFRAGGHGRHAVYALRCGLADQIGDEPAARRWLSRWRAAEPDENSGCSGCDPGRWARLLAGWDDWAAAVRAVEPLLDEPPRCVEQPEQGLAAVLLPYLRLGRHADAARAHVRAYRRHRQERDAFRYLPDHLRFCALAGQHRRGLEILGRHLAWLDRPPDEAAALEFATAGALVCRLAASAGFAGRTIHRPGYADRLAAPLTVTALGAELRAMAEDLATRFDARNGTAHQSARVARWLAQEPVGSPIPLPPDDADELTEAWAAAGPDPVLPLRLESVAAILDERGDRYVRDDVGAVCGRWGDALVQFERLGERDEILHARIVADRRLPVGRLAEAYRFCNAWNHDRLLPKAYVHEQGDGWLLLAADVSTDLEHGVSEGQLAVLVAATVATAAAFAAAVADLS